VLVVGYAGGQSDQAEIYDPATGTFSLTGAQTNPSSQDRRQRCSKTARCSSVVAMASAAVFSGAEVFDPAGYVTPAPNNEHVAELAYRTRLNSGSVPWREAVTHGCIRLL